jgi:hypothetical protein
MPTPEQMAEQLASQAATALPKWKCHKEVWAAKITKQDRLLLRDGMARWYLDNGGYVDANSMLRERVTTGDPVGGYYVRYEDGFESWSPAKAFEEGYTRI